MAWSLQMAVTRSGRRCGVMLVDKWHFWMISLILLWSPLSCNHRGLNGGHVCAVRGQRWLRTCQHGWAALGTTASEDGTPTVLASRHWISSPKLWAWNSDAASSQSPAYCSTRALWRPTFLLPFPGYDGFPFKFVWRTNKCHTLEKYVLRLAQYLSGWGLEDMRCSARHWN